MDNNKCILTNHFINFTLAKVYNGDEQNKKNKQKLNS